LTVSVTTGGDAIFARLVTVGGESLSTASSNW
jgi:hypothetical protein